MPGESFFPFSFASGHQWVVLVPSKQCFPPCTLISGVEVLTWPPAVHIPATSQDREGEEWTGVDAGRADALDWLRQCVCTVPALLSSCFSPSPSQYTAANMGDWRLDEHSCPTPSSITDINYDHNSRSREETTKPKLTFIEIWNKGERLCCFAFQQLKKTVLQSCF